MKKPFLTQKAFTEKLRTPAEVWVWKRMHEVPQDENFQVSDLLDAFKAGDANRVSELRQLHERIKSKAERIKEVDKTPTYAHGACDNLGKLPPIGERWEKPSELAEDISRLLAELDKKEEARP